MAPRSKRCRHAIATPFQFRQPSRRVHERGHQSTAHAFCSRTADTPTLPPHGPAVVHLVFPVLLRYRICMGYHANRRSNRRAASCSTDSGTRIVLDNLRLLVRSLRVSARGAEKTVGVSGAQLFVLQTLNDARVASVGELASRTHTDQSSVSVVVDRLARRGLVSRTESKTDGRRLEIRLTTRGRSLLRRSPESTQTRLISAIDELPRGMRDQLGAALGKLARAMGISGEPHLFFEDEPRLRRATGNHART
jgi:MarR family transcriptional regulator, lower aerobic nicotinate degradation pathway regulator